MRRLTYKLHGCALSTETKACVPLISMALPMAVIAFHGKDKRFTEPCLRFARTLSSTSSRCSSSPQRASATPPPSQVINIFLQWGQTPLRPSTLVCTGLLTGVEGLKTDGVAVGGAWFCLLCDVANRVKSEALK